MDFFHLNWLFGPAKPPVQELPTGVHVHFAFLCMDCERIYHGAFQGKCKGCQSKQIVAVGRLITLAGTLVQQKLEAARKSKQVVRMAK